MAKQQLGIKRACPHCGTRYYDLGKDPITCPKCGTVFEPPVISRVRSEPARARPVPVPAVEEEVVEEEEEEAELVPLEDADEEETASAKKPLATDEDDDEVEEVDEELGGNEFLEEEEDDTDVSDLIDPDVDDEEER